MRIEHYECLSDCVYAWDRTKFRATESAQTKFDRLCSIQVIISLEDEVFCSCWSRLECPLQLFASFSSCIILRTSAIDLQSVRIVGCFILQRACRGWVAQRRLTFGCARCPS